MGEAYISFEPGIDVFSYLTPELIKNELVKLEFNKNCQILRFYGENKGALLLELEKAVSTGEKKNNKPLLETKINQKIDLKIVINTYIHRLKIDNIPDEIIEKVIPLKITSWRIGQRITDKLRNGINDESIMYDYKLMKEIINEYTSIINEWISKNDHDPLEDTRENLIIK